MMSIKFNEKCEMCGIITMTKEYDVTLAYFFDDEWYNEKWRLCVNCHADIQRVKAFCNAEIMEIKDVCVG